MFNYDAKERISAQIHKPGRFHYMEMISLVFIIV